MSDPMTALWATRGADARAPSRQTLAARSRTLRRRIALRDAREHIAGALVAIAFGWIGFTDGDGGVRIACLVLILGIVAVSAQLWHNRPKDDAAALGQDALAHYRAQLARQRDLLASVGRWYLGPLVPGMLLFVLAMARASVAQTGLAAALGTAAIATGVIAATFCAILWLNRRAARTLDAELAQLDRY